MDNQFQPGSKSMDESARNTYLAVRIGHNRFVLLSSIITEIIEKPMINHVPFFPGQVLGVTNVRNRIVPVYDMRKSLGLQEFVAEREEFVRTLRQREEDHKSWLSELEKCVRDKKEFTLQTDPHKCKFGMWYDSYKTDDFDLSKMLKAFDEPHKAIHALAITAKKLMNDNDQDAAIKLLANEGKYTLEKMIRLFDSFCSIVEALDRRILVIVNHNGNQKGMLVDHAEAAVIVLPDQIIEKNIGGVDTHKFVKLEDEVAEMLEADSVFM